MNRYEAVLLDKMLDIRAGGFDGDMEEAHRAIMLLLDCIAGFREPPRAIAVDEGYGALARTAPDWDTEVMNA